MRLTMFSPGMSSAVTRMTLDQSNEGSRSRATKRACASVERIVAPYHAPGKTRSSAYLASPVSFDGPSRRSGDPHARPAAISASRMTSGSGALRRGSTAGRGRVGGVRIVIGRQIPPGR
jgi:hypothetical protein